MPVKAGEPVVEFDPADQQYALEQAKSELAEAEQEIVKMKADAAVQERAGRRRAADRALRRPPRRSSTPSANEFIGALDAQKNVLSLEEARRRLAQLLEDVEVARARPTTASLAVVQEKRNKAQLAMQRAQQVIDSLVIKAPFDGVVSRQGKPRRVRRHDLLGHGPAGYRAGDQISPGRPVADVIESGRMEVRAKIDESDRANLVGGPARGRRSRRPAGRDVQGADRRSSPAWRSRGNFFESAGVTRLFDVTLAVRPARPPAQGRCRPRA